MYSTAVSVQILRPLWDRRVLAVTIAVVTTVCALSLNIAQCLGWGVFELVTIATAAHTVAPALPRWAYVTIAGAATAALTIRPLGAIRVLRR